MSMVNGWTSLLWFLAILAAIPVVLWLLRRSPMLGGQAQPGTPRTVATMAISPSQRLLTVEVGQGEERVWLVLGVTPQGIRTLHTMAPLSEPPPVAPVAPGTTFAQLLNRLRNGGSGDHAR